MSIKKEILNALNTKETEVVVKLNDISHLVRYTKDWQELKADDLVITFDYVVGYKGGLTYEIKSRDYEGILDEIENYTKDYLLKCAEKAAKNLRNGVK